MSVADAAAIWVQAVGSAGALLAFAAYVWVALLNRRDEAERYAESQARRVAVWLDEGARYEMDSRYVLRVYNAGESPVFSCQAWIRFPGVDTTSAAHLHVVPPLHGGVQPVQDDDRRLDEEEFFSAAAVPQLEFTDSSGWRWFRGTDGVLERADGRRGRIRRKPAFPPPSDRTQGSATGSTAPST
ncbi:MAG TPA: hypothetical protein VE152_13635 [Acidimicrobiales bacterium]|nr:hypothetical protein [Acidimicrobiales bacterium]